MLGVFAGVFEDEALGGIDFEKDGFVVIVAAVGAVHDEAPEAVGADVHLKVLGGEADGAPPLDDVSWVGPHLED